MLPSSAIQVIERTPLTLVIVDPPYYLLGGGFLATWAVSLPVAIFVGLRYGVTRKALLWWVLTSAPLLLVGVVLCTGRTTVTFSRETGRVTIERSYVGLRLRTQEFPLDQVARAVLETARGGRSLVLVTRSASPIVLTTFSDRAGHYEAAEAINQFLRLKQAQ